MQWYPLGTITRGFVVANQVEAVLWFAVAGIVFAKWRNPLAAIALIAFGVSDLVETLTGAWWRPWWLLTWKTMCVVVLLGLVLRAWRMKKTGALEEEGAPAEEEA
jgi:hypothetical protein